MTPDRKAELRGLAAEMECWETEDLASEQQCMSCHVSVHTPSDLEPTPLCDLCAQTHVQDVPDLLSEVDRLESDLAERNRVIAEYEASGLRMAQGCAQDAERIAALEKALDESKQETALARTLQSAINMLAAYHPADEWRDRLVAVLAGGK